MNIAPTSYQMNKKPVFERAAKTVLNMNSGFKHKLLCDGPVFSAGDACGYSCAFCYVGAMTDKLLRVGGSAVQGMPHESIVVRRSNAVELLRQQLSIKGKGGRFRLKYDNANDNRVLFMSHAVDVAANTDLLHETAEACAVILTMTAWHIRVLSKSSFLPMLPGLLTKKGIPLDEVRERMIFGVSTGTLDDALAASFEIGCAKVSKRLQSLRVLQDSGFRTYGMLCPILPQPDYAAFADSAAKEIRVDKCEHVWAEVLNPRGSNMAKMIQCLSSGGYQWHADRMREVTEDQAAWERYAHDTFLALQPVIPAKKLRFLQYVTNATRPAWERHVKRKRGAILL